MPFTIVRQDITKMKVDAIVNAANTELQMGGGVCGAIFRAAGAQELQDACDQLAPIKTGEAVITPGFALPAKFVIHAAGPVYSRYSAEQSEQLLRSAYLNSLRLTVANQCQSIAFPLISSGIYGYPKAEALQVATAAIRGFLADHDLDVYLAVVDQAIIVVSEKLLEAVDGYLDTNYAEKSFEAIKSKLPDGDGLIFTEALYDCYGPVAAPSRPGIDDLVGNLDESFSYMLLKLIDAKGMTDVEVYKRANLDRKLFSKIRTGKGYMPSKRTAIALAIALELTIDETNDLLKRAGYALSRSQKFDVIIEYFIINGKYNIFEINEVLFKYDQPLLGG